MLTKSAHTPSVSDGLDDLVSTRLQTPAGWHLRGLGITMLVFSLVAQIAGAQGWLQGLHGLLQPFALPAFFLIAGLSLTSTDDAPLVRFFDRSILPFVYFYLVWAALYSLVTSLGEQAPLTALSRLDSALLDPPEALRPVYLLPLFIAAARWLKRFPATVIVALAAAFEVIHLNTGIALIDAISKNFVYFLAGYVFAPQLFRLSSFAQSNNRIAIFGLFALALVNLALVLGPADQIGARSLAELPFASLALGMSGSIMLILLASLLPDTTGTLWLSSLGQNALAISVMFPTIALIIIKFSQALVGNNLPGIVIALIAGVALCASLLLARLLGQSSFCFLVRRPRWAWLSPPDKTKPTQALGFKSNLSPAE